MNTIASASQLTSELQSQLSKIIIAPIYQYYANDQIGGFRFLYSPKSDIKNGWTYEKLAFYGFDKKTPGVVPVYQYNNVYSDGGMKYYYTTKVNEGNNWKPDVPVPAFYAYAKPQSFTRPVYQYYANDLKDGGKKYFYSTDANGARNGWTLDFVAFHVAIAEKLELAVDITQLTIDNLSSIFEATDPLIVAIEFAGQGNLFEYFAQQALAFEVEYFAEGFGSSPDVTLGTISGKLVQGQLTYRDAVTTLTIPRVGNKLGSGLYEIGAILTIRDRQNQVLVNAFSEGFIIQVFS